MLNIVQPLDCRYSSKKVARLIKDYCREFSHFNNPYRSANLSMLEDLARENNVKLPTADEILSNKPDNRFICTFVSPKEFTEPVEMKCSFDGENFVGYIPKTRTVEYERYPRSQWDELFDILYPRLKAQPEFDESGKSRDRKFLIRVTLQKKLLHILMFNGLFKKYDAYCYSAFTDDLPLQNSVRSLSDWADLKTKQIISFRKEFQNLGALKPDPDIHFDIKPTKSPEVQHEKKSD